MSASSSPHPGVLVDHQLRRFLKDGQIRSYDAERIQPSSLDLTVGTTVWEIAALPAMGAETGFHFQHFIDHYARNQFGLVHNTATLSPGSVYIAELQGEYYLPAAVYGYASPKSSTGRIDVHCTVVAEGAEGFNTVPKGYKGKLYALIVPQSFPIILSQGDALVQLRLFQGQRQFLSIPEMQAEQKAHSIIKGSKVQFTDHGAALRLSLHGTPSNLVAQVIGKPVNLRRFDQDPHIYFNEKPRDNDALFLEPNQFLLATTVERVRVPTNLCAEMIAYREEYGELRAHYAGFFDPGFGFGRDGEIADSGAVCEIRNIGTAPIMLSHGQPICLLRYEKLSEPADQVYGDEKRTIQSNYQGQSGIKLAKFFKPWEEHAEA
jgi:dCTP deaminase